MNSSASDKVNEFLVDLSLTSPERLEIIEAIRNEFLSASKGLDEDIKYGGIVYSLANALIGGIYPYANHISIEFSHGSEFDDPEGLLEGKGKFRRHVKIDTIADISSKRVKRYIKQAVLKGKK